jgi:uncharacterized protein (TIGR03086 family)
MADADSKAPQSQAASDGSAAGLLKQLALALDICGQLVESVRPAQWDGATPCPQWRARDLISHLIGGNIWFASSVSGTPPTLSPPRPDGWPDDELAPAYRASAAALLGAFSQPGAFEKIVTVPIGKVPGIVAVHLRLTEVLVHGWDLAQATGQQPLFPEDLAEQELEFTIGKLPDVPPDRRPFGPPQPVADDAAAIDRLAACLGREIARQRLT